MRSIVRALLPTWFLLIFLLALNHVFVGQPKTPPVALGAAFLAPILIFLAALALIPAFRTYILEINPVFLAALHGWRLIGFGFLMAYSEHLLSASFALPASIGDIVVAILAPWIVLRLTQDTHFARSSFFLAWNLFGIADFLVAIATGALDRGVLPFFQPAITSSMMARLPSVLIPAFLVPWLFITHIIMLMQRRRAANHSYLNASAGSTLAALPLG